MMDWITAADASKRWGLEGSTIRQAIRRGRFKEGEYQKLGRDWLVTISAMKRLYGEEKSMIDKIENVLEVQNLGIDYESFTTGDELADYLDGRMFPGFDEPFEVSEEQREALNEIYKDR